MNFKTKNEYLKFIYNNKSSFENKFHTDYFYRYNIEWVKKYSELLTCYFKNTLNYNNSFSLIDFHNYIDSSFFKTEENDKPTNNRNKLSTIVFNFVEKNEKIYHDFILWLYKDIIKEDFYFQKIPTIRIYLPNSEPNPLPLWHSDCFLGHSPKEMNIWFSLTKNEDLSFFLHDLNYSREWLRENHYDADEFLKNTELKKPDFNEKGFEGNPEKVNALNDNIFLFDSRCIHTPLHRPMHDRTTRVSFDTRIILKKDFEWLMINEKPVFIGKGIKKAHFKPGGKFGYDERSAEELKEAQ